MTTYLIRSHFVINDAELIFLHNATGTKRTTLFLEFIMFGL